MSRVDFVGSELLTDSGILILDRALDQALSILADFATDESFEQKIIEVFGDQFDTQKLDELRQNFTSSSLDWLPKFEIRSADELNGANAAFAASNNRVYLSQDFISANSSDIQKTTDVLLEELGHLIDSTINTEDTPGDEGEYFSYLVQGKELDSEKVATIKSDQDFLSLHLDESSTLLYETQTFRPEEIEGKLYVAARDLARFPVGTHQFLIIEIFNIDSNLSKYLTENYSDIDIEIENFNNSSQQLSKNYIVIGAHNPSDRLQVEFSRESDLDAAREKFTGKREALISWDPELHEVKFSDSTSVSSDFIYDLLDAVRAYTLNESEIPIYYPDILGSGEPGCAADSKNHKSKEKAINLGFPYTGDYVEKPVNSNSWAQSIVRFVGKNRKEKVNFPENYMGFDCLSENRIDNWYFTLSSQSNSAGTTIADALDSSLTTLETLTEDKWSSVFSSSPVPFSNQEDVELKSFSSSSSELTPVENSRSIQVEASYDSVEEQKLNQTAYYDVENDSILVSVEANSSLPKPINFLGEIRNTLVPIFRQLSNEDNLESVQKLLVDALDSDGLNLVDSEDDIEVTGDINGDFAVNLSLNSDLPLIERSLSADFGLPWLGLEVVDGGTVKTAFNYEFDFSFGLRDGEFFFDTPEEEDLSIRLDTSIPDVDFNGNLGFFQFNITDEDTDTNSDNDGVDIDGDGLTPSKVSLGAAIDLDFSDESIAIKDFNPTGEADINLNLKTSFDDSVVLPSIETDLDIDLDFINESDPEITFRDVQLGLGSFLSRVAGPTFDVIQEVTGTFPIKKITDTLVKKQFLLWRKSLAEVAEKAGSYFSDVYFDPQTLEFIKVASEIAEVVNWINSISADSQNTKINFGDFTVNGAEVQNGGLESVSPILSGEETDDFLDSSENVINGFTSTLEDSSTNLTFPILTEPTTAFNLLLGKPVDLFNLDLPVIGLGFEYTSPQFPIFGPLSVQILGRAGAAANLDFGFDTYGLEQFKASGYQDPSLIAQGLYVADLPTDSVPQPLDGSREGGFAAGLGAGIAADVGIDLGILRASVEAGIAGTTYLDLLPDESNLPDDDPRKYREGRKHILDFDNLGCVFELEGGLDAILGAKIRIGFGPFSFSKRITIVRETLVDFHAGCSDGDGDGAIEEDGILKLKTNGGNDLVLVNHIDGELGAETIEVESYAVEYQDTENGEISGQNEPRGNASYNNIKQIEGNGGKGKDRIEIGNTVLAPTFIKGGGNDDELFGGSGLDTLEGNDGDDFLSGGKGNDVLKGGKGNDFFEGGEGNNTIDGGKDDDGKDVDAISYANETEGITGKLAPDADGKIYVKRANGQTDTIINVEQFDLTNKDDVMTGTDQNNEVIDGLDGNDKIYGLGGDDFLIGGLGADLIDGGEEGKKGDGTSYIKGDRTSYIKGDGTSYLNSFAGVRIDLETGFATGGEATGDQLISIEHILATIHPDDLRGNEKANILNGSEGNDVIEGREGADQLDGGGVRGFFGSSDKDVLSYESSSTGIAVSLKDGKGTGGEANGDSIAFAFFEKTSEFSKYSSFENLTGSNQDDNKLEGDLGHNEIRGLEGNDNLYGDGGNDTLIGGVGADKFNGGEGEDWADYSEALSSVGVDLASQGFRGEGTGDTFEKQNSQSTTENLKGSPYGDTFFGDIGNNDIDPDISSGETDFVDGREGDDLLIVNYGIRNDWGSGITGGFDSDNATSGYISRQRTDLNGQQLNDAISFFNIERSQIIGTIQSDNIQGGGGFDTIFAGVGDDLISGGNGNDRIQADDGDDILIGGAGADVLDGGEGQDTASYENARFSGVYVDLEKSFQEFVYLNPFSDAAGDQLISIENLHGSIYDDWLFGNNQANQLYGDAGNDNLTGKGGADTLDGGSGINTASYSNSLEGVRINLETGNILGGDAEGDTLINIQNITGSSQDDSLAGDSSSNNLRGLEGDDLLQGNGNNDTLLGGDGSDTLEGGSGNDVLKGTSNSNNVQEVDVLTGGDGADEFYLGNSSSDYYKASDSYAIITDFNPSEDTIHLYFTEKRCSRLLPDYYLASTGDTLPTGIGIFSRGSRETNKDELIGIIQGGFELDLQDDYFSFNKVHEEYCNILE
ncbi:MULTISPECIES: calcium-binding protein [Moorena]|nr:MULTISPECIES: calcium-binding protein [Moorena]NEP69712.1 calcium-binding protein [Moorena sp. SIO3A5]